MPNKTYKGVLDGALIFLNKATSSTTQTNKKGFQIKNRYALALGLTLRTDTTHRVKPTMRLTHVTSGVDSGSKFSPSVKVHLVNPRPTLITQMKIKSTVSKLNGKILYKSSQKNMAMAASSNFNYAISTQSKALKAGKYHLHLVATSGHYKWVFNRNFTITATQAKKVNQHAIIKHNYLWLWIALGILLLALLLWLVYRLGQRNSKQK